MLYKDLEYQPRSNKDADQHTIFRRVLCQLTIRISETATL